MKRGIVETILFLKPLQYDSHLSEFLQFESVFTNATKVLGNFMWNVPLYAFLYLYVSP